VVAVNRRIGNDVFSRWKGYAVVTKDVPPYTVVVSITTRAIHKIHMAEGIENRHQL
jgi:serine acetyltransferase